METMYGLLWFVWINKGLYGFVSILVCSISRV